MSGCHRDSIEMGMAPLGRSERVIQSTCLLSLFYVNVNEQLRHVRTNDLICGSETRHMLVMCGCVFLARELNSFCTGITRSLVRW